MTALSRTVLWTVIAGAALCASGCNDPSTAWVNNDSDVVIRARFWCGPRATGDDPATLTPGEVFDVDPGKSVTVHLDAASGFASPAESIVRLQAEPLGVGFKRVVQHWFEINPPGPYGVKAVGVKPDIRAERDGPGTMSLVPLEHRSQPAAD